MAWSSDRLALAACAVAVALGACSDERNPAPALDAIDPSVVGIYVSTPAEIRGSNLFGVAAGSFDEDWAPTVDHSWRVALGTVELPAADVSHMDTSTLAVIVPAGLAPGLYSVTVTSPDGRTATLEDALDVRDEPLGLAVSIETAPGGAGELVDARTLRAGETLDVYAVARDESGIFKTDVDVTWSVDNGIGVVGPGPSAMATFEARSVGTGLIRAANPFAEEATSGQITVQASDAASVVIVDAPAGAGAEVGDLPGLTTDDDDIDLYAASVDAFGNFTGDVAVTWSISGGIGSIAPGPQMSATPALTTPGTGTVQITHATLGTDTTGLLTVAPGQVATIEVQPDTLVINADDAPAAFTAVAADADGNPTTDVGTLTWSVEGGPITALDPSTGVLDPGDAGSAMVRATSSYGPFDDSGTVTIVAGRAAVLTVSPDTLTVDADAAAVPFAVAAGDGDGNATADLGVITWTVSAGPITDLDPGTGIFDPQAAGTGTVRATSSYGPFDDSGAITVTAGQLAALTVAPDTLTLSADDAPAPFMVTGVDADNNPTMALGTISWTISSGPITAIDSMSGVFDPAVAGTGTVRATSSIGAIFDDSGDITVVPGQVDSFVVSPDTAATYIGGPTVAFSVTSPVDGDGNPTADLGTITWTEDTVASIDAGSGVFTPSVAGTGFVTATSSYGASDDSGSVAVYPSGIVVTDVSAPATVNRGQAGALVSISVFNATPDDAKLVSMALTFSQGVSVDSDYTIRADYRNAIIVGSGATEVLEYRVDVATDATLGAIDISADVLAYMEASSDFDSDSNATTWDALALTLPTAVISAPVFPDNHICAGDTVSFAGNASSGAVSWDWLFSGAAPSSSTAVDPSGIGYGTGGNYPYWLTVTGASGAQDSATGPTPIFVGTETVPPHITGEIIFETPSTPGESIQIGNLPKIDMAGDGDATNLFDCAGTPLLEADSTAYATVFVDRGVIDSARDLDPGLPGVQVELHQGTHFDNVDWLGLTPMNEGAAIVYAEYRHEPTGDVTAAGWLPVVMIEDDIRPTIDATLPLSQCGGPCYGKGQRWAFRFDEAMDEAALLANTTVRVEFEDDCDGGGVTDITAGSVLSYDADAHTLYVTPAVQASSPYSVTVRIAKEATDASSQANELNGGDFSFCAVLENRAAPAVPGTPSLVGISVDPISPDGDGSDELTKLAVSVSASTALVRLRIDDGVGSIFESVFPVPGDGTGGAFWGGRDNTGRVVPNGYYVYRLTAENALGDSSPELVGIIEVRSAVSLVGVPPWR